MTARCSGGGTGHDEPGGDDREVRSRDRLPEEVVPMDEAELLAFLRGNGIEI